MSADPYLAYCEFKMTLGGISEDLVLMYDLRDISQDEALELVKNDPNVSDSRIVLMYRDQFYKVMRSIIPIGDEQKHDDTDTKTDSKGEEVTETNADNSVEVDFTTNYTSEVVTSQRISFESCYISDESITGVRELNAHKYTLEASVAGPQLYEDDGSILEFSEFKTILRNIVPDKTFLYTQRSDVSFYPDKSIAQIMEHEGVNTRAYNFKISVEHLAHNFGIELQTILDREYPGVILTELKLREGSDSFVVYKPRR